MSETRTYTQSVLPQQPGADQVRQELTLILDSPAFRTSKRCHDFLEYAVSKALDGDVESLRERSLAVEVFGRKNDAALGDDSIVRVGAREVRKRLAQYYVTDGANDVLRIELPAGSYVPAFHWSHAASHSEPATLSPEAPSITAAPLRNRQADGLIWRRWLIGTAVLLAGAGLVILTARNGKVSGDFEAFWQPVFSQQGPVLIGLAHPLVYHPSSRLLALDEEQNGANGVAQRPIHVAASLQPDDYVPAVDQYVGFGDAVAGARLALLFAQHGRDSKLRLASKVEFADLRDSSSVLIGAFTNRWTSVLARTLRYRFEGRKGKPAILDANTGQEWILTGKKADGGANEDFILLCRLVRAPTGGFTVIGAGLTQYGTQEAGLFLSSPEALTPILKKLPAG
jgi:hypothetical protein